MIAADVLLVAANGRTGRAILKALLQRGLQTRAFVRNADHDPVLRSLGAAQVVVGDLCDTASVERAATGCRALRGNPTVLATLLDRAPTTFEQYAKRVFSGA